MAAGPDAEVDIGSRDAQVGEEDVGHVGVIVLPGVDDDVSVFGRGHLGGDRGQLDELGAGPDDAEDLHGAAGSRGLVGGGIGC